MNVSLILRSGVSKKTVKSTFHRFFQTTCAKMVKVSTELCNSLLIFTSLEVRFYTTNKLQILFETGLKHVN